MPPASETQHLMHALTGQHGPSIEIRKLDGYVNATRMCKASGKHWYHFAENTSTQSFLKCLAAQTGQTVSELMQSKHGGSTPGTWVHPQVAIRLAAWCSNRKRKLSARGYVYAVTSDVLNAVKIGMWTGSSHNLKSRYQTPYGPSLQIWCVVVNDCVAAEVQLHKQFKEFNKGGELFDKSELVRYQEAFSLLGSVECC